MAVIEAVAVVVPAHDEEELVGDCLRSVLQALDTVCHIPMFVILVAHNCSDATASIAESILAERGAVVKDKSATVMSARRRGVAVALEHFVGIRPDRLWLLSTDADTTVPTDWVERILRHATLGAHGVAGLAELDSWHGLPEAGRRLYKTLLAEGIHGDEHSHAYAANLAVRSDAYLDVGGWPDVAHGEETALLANLEATDYVVRRPVDVVVTTSGRRIARAPSGLGELLKNLAGRELRASS